jgi:hypothetical protein
MSDEFIAIVLIIALITTATIAIIKVTINRRRINTEIQSMKLNYLGATLLKANTMKNQAQVGKVP